MGFELDPQGNPLVSWQADSGLVSRIKRDGKWEDPVEIASVKPPETPAEFGPGRWVQPTAELRTVVSQQGQIFAAWLIPSMGFKMGVWSGNAWTDTIDIMPPEEIGSFSCDEPYFGMVMDEQDRIHFTYFVDADYPDPSQLHYTVFSNQKLETQLLPIHYDMYGYPYATIVFDSIGSIALLALPLEPAYEVKLPSAGIPPTPTPTPKPAVTPRPSWTPAISSYTTPIPQKNIWKSNIPSITGLLFLMIVLIIGIVFLRVMKK